MANQQYYLIKNALADIFFRSC